MLHWLGGAASLVVVLVPLLVPFYAVYGSYYTSFFAATVMLIVLAASQVAQGRAALTAAFVTEMPLYYLLAALSGYLAHGRIRRQEEQEALQRLVRLENEARSLSGAVRTIQESADLAPTLQEMVEAVPVLTGLPDCLVALLDRKSGALVTRATTADLTRMGVERVDYLVEWPREGNLFDAVMTHNAPVAISSQGGNLHLMPQWAQQLKTGPLLCVPLGSRGVDVGVMFFFGVPAEYEFTGRDMQLAQAFANLIALVAVNAQLYEDVQVTVASVMSDLRPVVLPKPTAKPRHFTTIEVGDLLVDLPNRQAKIAGKVVNLTPTEFDLLAVLAENNGHAVDQDNLLRRVWGEDYHGRSTVVDVGVHRLRRKIEEGQGAPRRIITVRGSGYMLVPGTAMPRQGVD
jgi:DNA-binding winged helix-turn-helix (wHTH) protein